MQQVLDRVILGMSGILAASTFFFAAMMFSPLPWWDAWHVVLLDENLQHLFHRNNEHLIVLPRIIFAADTIVARGTGLLSIAFVWLAQIGVFYAIWRAAKKGPWYDSAGIMGIISAFVFAGRHVENLGWQFQPTFVGCALVSVLAICATSLAGRKKYGLVGLMLSASAPFWSAQGLVVPIACAFICLIALRRVKLASVHLAILIASVLIYIASPSVLGQSLGGSVTFDLQSVLLTFATQTGFPLAQLLTLGSMPPAPLLIASGVIPIFVLGWSSWGLWSNRSTDVKIAALTGIGLVGLGVAALISLGRAGDGDIGGPSYRYFIFSALLWAPTALLIVHRLHRLVTPVIAVLLLVGFLLQQPWFFYFSNAWSIQRDVAALAILQNIDDVQALAPTYPAPEFLTDRLIQMRDQGLSVFFQHEQPK